jgi:hypothetical protein
MVERKFSFVDLADFTALTEAYGDLDALDLLDHFTSLARASLSADDELLKTIGDAVMLASPGPAIGSQGSNMLRRTPRTWATLASKGGNRAGRLSAISLQAVTGQWPPPAVARTSQSCQAGECFPEVAALAPGVTSCDASPSGTRRNRALMASVLASSTAIATGQGPIPR